LAFLRLLWFYLVFFCLFCASSLALYRISLLRFLLYFTHMNICIILKLIMLFKLSNFDFLLAFLVFQLSLSSWIQHIISLLLNLFIKWFKVFILLALNHTLLINLNRLMLSLTHLNHHITIYKCWICLIVNIWWLLSAFDLFVRVLVWIVSFVLFFVFVLLIVNCWLSELTFCFNITLSLIHWYNLYVMLTFKLIVLICHCF